MQAAFSLAVIVLYCISLVIPQHAGIQQVLHSADRNTEAVSSDHSTRLNFSSSAPHIFASQHGLLRQGFNTFFPNGFSVAACRIPAFTPLYHGWLDGSDPGSPEWLSFTPDMAYGIMGSTRDSFLTTYKTTRSIRCLYFDGASAALWGGGTLDTQMNLIYGNTTGDPTRNQSWPVSWDEYDRAGRLCNWIQEQFPATPGSGIEGIIRMNAGFEIIWCNFSSSSLRMISRLNVSAPLLESTVNLKTNRNEASSRVPDFNGPVLSPSGPGMTVSNNRREPFLVSQYWSMLTRAMQTYNVDGLASYRQLGLDVVGFEQISLYSAEYQVFSNFIAEQERQQLNLSSEGYWNSGEDCGDRERALSQLMRRRSKHRVGNLTDADVARFRVDLGRIVSRLSRTSPQAFDVDRESHDIPWGTLHDLVIETYSIRLLQFRRLLEKDHHTWKTSWSAAKAHFTNLREMAHSILVPYLPYKSIPRLVGYTTLKKDIEQNAIARCKITHVPDTTAIDPADHITSRWPIVVNEAFEEVMHNICSVLIFVGLDLETAWYQMFDRTLGQKDGWLEQSQQDTIKWRNSIQELMAWLGWAPHWTKCEEMCNWDEKCYIPIWPVFQQMHISKPAYDDFTYINPELIERDLWHPRCMKRDDFPATAAR